MIDEDEDQDISEFYKEHKRRGQEKRAENRVHSTKLLESAGIKFESFNGGAHLRVFGANRVDFWPGTGYWKDLTTDRRGRGVHNLLNHLKEIDP